MKLKVEKEFKDKYTGELYKVNDVIEVSEGRGKEILADSRKLVSVVKPRTSKAKK